MTNGRSPSGKSFFIGAAQFNPKKRGVPLSLVHCLLYIPAGRIYLMRSEYDLIAAVKRLHERHDFHEDHSFECEEAIEVVNDLGVEDLEDGNVFYDNDNEETFEILCEDLMTNTLSCKKDREESSWPFLDEGELYAMVLADLEKSDPVKASLIKAIVVEHPTDAEEDSHLEPSTQLATVPRCLSDIRQDELCAHPFHRNPMFCEDDFTFSLQDVPSRLIAKHGLIDMSVLTAQFNVVADGIDKVFHPRPKKNEGWTGMTSTQSPDLDVIMEEASSR